MVQHEVRNVSQVAHKVAELTNTRVMRDVWKGYMLMYLRHRAAGKCREFLSDSPAKMRRPVKIDENLYGEAHYGSETLIHILCKRILDPVHYDYSDIKVVIKM